MLASCTSVGKPVLELTLRDVVMSEASSRNEAVCVSAGKGVVGRWVRIKAESQVWVGTRPFDVSCAEIWAARVDD